jgi:hypothetical protein
VGGFLTGRGYPPSIELNSNSIFSGRESDATQSCNSIELNHFGDIFHAVVREQGYSSALVLFGDSISRIRELENFLLRAM